MHAMCWRRSSDWQRTMTCDRLPGGKSSSTEGERAMAETPTIASSYTFDPFARHQFYHDVNESLVRRAIDRLDAAMPKGRAAHVVELASGTGAVTELILDEMERLGRPGSVTGIEPSTEAVEIARERLAGRQVEFIQGEA